MFADRRRYGRVVLWALGLLMFVTNGAGTAAESYTNFESSHVNPIAISGNQSRVVAVNTPASTLEVFLIAIDGSLIHEHSIPVGLEPVSVTFRTDQVAWVVSQMSDAIQIVNVPAGEVQWTLKTCDEPTDVEIVGLKAFVSCAGADEIWVHSTQNLNGTPQIIPLMGRKPRALDVSLDGTKIYAVVLHSGNQTTVIPSQAIFEDTSVLDTSRLNALGENDFFCDGPRPSYPPLPPGITRNPALTDPADGIPRVGLIVKYNNATGNWEDEAGQDWSNCVQYELADQDLFEIDVASLAVTPVQGVGTTLFDVSVQPGSGKVWVSNTEARNHVRFEHPLGLNHHLVENQLTVIDPANAFAVNPIDLNGHINRAAGGSVAERAASISQPGNIAWSADGSTGYVTGLGSDKIFQIDGTCTTANCIFGADRANPIALNVGGGPTGVIVANIRNRAYVLSRFDNSITQIDLAGWTVEATYPMLDPSSFATKQGRRFLYNAELLSKHGDVACSTCHISGDHDFMAWDLGNPEGSLQLYSDSNDNVRFINAQGPTATDCDEGDCQTLEGFDPQKGPMTTQTFRGMLEPLHWRGDRATVSSFNPAYVSLLGAEDVGPVNGAPGGLNETDVEIFRQFALAITYPSNPHRTIDNQLPNVQADIPGANFTGNPVNGETAFLDNDSVGANHCVACHTLPFGAAGGTLGGVQPTTPTSTQTAALIDVGADPERHSDLKVGHLRNVYERFGPSRGDGSSPVPLVRTGFGLTHDGSIGNIATFLSLSTFQVGVQEARDMAAYISHFDTGTSPVVGRSVTFPKGAPGNGTQPEEALLVDMLALGDANDPNRQCELIATTRLGGEPRRFRWDNGGWERDEASLPTQTTEFIRVNADQFSTFMCVPIGSGARLGGDVDFDATLDYDDCAPENASLWSAPPALNIRLGLAGAITFPTPSPGIFGPVDRFEILTANLGAFAADPAGATSCLESDVSSGYVDSRPAPAPGEAFIYLARGANDCGTSPSSTGRESLDALTCN